MKFRNALLAAVSIFTIFGLPSSAFAEEAEDELLPKAEVTSDPRTIIVTARRREEALQDVPLAINAYNAEQIERERIRRVEDLTRLIAGLTYDVGAFPNDTRPALRGMQAERGRPSVAILLDGQDLSGENLAIAGGSAALEMNLFDLERVEIVKGPQVTLYGRNAFAGAINYISKAPSFDFGARVNAETATGSLVAVSGSITGPIIKDILAFRLNANYRDSDGYYQVPGTGDKVGAQNSKGIAASLLLTPTAGLKISGRYQYSEDRASDNPTAFIKSNTRVPVPSGTFSPFPGGPVSACPASLTGVSPAIFNSCTRATFIGDENGLQMGRNPLTGQPPFGMRMSQNLASADITWDTGSIGTFHYQFGWLKNTSLIEQDGDFTDGPAPPGFVLSLQSIQDLQYRNKHTDHTLVWSYDNDWLTLLAGAQFFKETSSLRNSTQFFLRSATSPLGGPPFNINRAPVANFPFPSVTSRRTEYEGYFGAIGIEPFKGFRLRAEGRYNKDRIAYVTTGWRLQDISLQRLTPVCPSPFPQGQAFNPNLPAFIPQPAPGTVVACPQATALKYSKFTPRFTADYKITDDVMVYASYAKGFKPGGANTNEITTFTDQTFLPERVATIEAGIKSTFFDKRLMLNLDAYRNRYRDQQIGIQRTASGAGNVIVSTAGIINAGKVNIWGIEADMSVRIIDPFTFSLNYAYTDTNYSSYVQGPRPGSIAADFTACGVPFGQTSSDQNRAEAGNVCGDLSGNQVPKSPKHALNLSGLYRQDIGNAMVFFEGTASYRSSRFVDDNNNVTLPSYWLASAKVGAELGNYSITVYVDNLFNNKKITSAQRVIDLANPEGFAPGRGYIAYLPKPRVFGLQVAAKF
jgi:iron complex outermembrane recepter protein